MRQMPMTTEMTTLHRTSPIAWYCITSTSIESAHHERAQSCCLCTFIHTHIGSSLAFVRTSLHHHGHPCGCCLFDLISSFYLFAFFLSFFLFPFFHLSDEQQPELGKGVMEYLCDSATNGGEGTYDVLYLTTSSDEESAAVT